MWCPWRESNPHSSRNTILSRARLPVPPHGHRGCSIASNAFQAKGKIATRCAAESENREQPNARRSAGLASARKIVTLARRQTGMGPGAMTDVAMRASWNERIRREPAVAAALAIFAGSAATILGAWYFQYVLKLPPCPLCLEERMPYHIVIPLSLLLAIAAIVRAPRALIVIGFLAIIAAMLASAALGAYHAGVEWGWWPGPVDCSGPITDFTVNGPLLKQLQSIRVVRCDEAAWRFLGLSLAGYNVLISLALAAIAAFGLTHRQPA
jgi:disulfide bond formation protein DsbB